MDRLQAMRTFMQVLEAGTFTSAAAALGVGQPTVSKHVSRLEAELGVSLLDRSTHDLSPTPAGAELYRRSVALLAAAEAAEAATKGADGRPSGTLRVSAPPILWPVLARRLAQLLAESPALSLTVVGPDSSADVTLSLAARGGAPVLVGVQRAYAAPSWLEEHGTPSEPSALSSLPCVSCAGQRQWLLGGEPVTISARMTVPDLSAAAAAAAAGVGAALLPEWAADGLVSLLPEHAGLPLPVWAQHPEHRFLPPAIAALLEHLAIASGEEDGGR
ncbi:MAG: DNA-binding transcriptional LysR family regulator [Myxococcota bacterium]